MKRNRAIAIILIISMLCTLVQCFQEKNVLAEDAEGFIYEINDGEVTIISYNGDITGDLIIPDYIEGYPVTVIGDSAFDYGTELHAFIDGRLQLPENLKRIGHHAFCGCCFGESLSFPEGLEYIGGYAFSDCGFLSGDLIIPDSVTEIGGMAFRHDSGFDGILKLSNQLKVINEMTFYYCSGVKGVLDLPDNLQGIRYSAFYGANHLVGPVVIPDSVEFIERSAFAACNINAMYVPATVTKIGQSALGIGGDGNTVYTPKDSLAYQVVTTDDYGNGSPTECRIANSAEEMMQMLGFADTPTPAPTATLAPTVTSSPTLPTATPVPSSTEVPNDFNYTIVNDEVTIISYNGDITGDLIIPDYIEGYPVTVIGDGAFNYGAEKDAFLGGRLQLPANLRKIGNYAFNECRFFGELKLPDGLEYIGAYAFARCIYFSGDLIIPDSVTDVMSGAFYEDSGFKGKLKLSNNMRIIHEYAFYWCKGFTGRLVLPEGLRGIKKCGFDALENITEPIVIPDSVIYLEDYAFSACRNIKAIYVPATVSAIVPTALSIGSENTVYTPAGSVAYETVTSNLLESYNNAKCKIANSAKEMMQMLGLADTPTPAPTATATMVPTPSPTATPTMVPIPSPTATPTAAPTLNPTSSPTKVPTPSPTATPTPSPTSAPTATPTKAPTPNPTVTPSPQPSSEPTMRPTTEPTDETTLVLPTSGPEGEAKLEQKGISTTMIPIPADTPAEPAPIPAPTAAPKKDNNTLSAPVFSLKKKVSSGKQKYIQIKLNRYTGSYIEVFVKVDNRSYVKLKLAESKISKIKKSLKFSYSFSKHTLYFKLRTYKKIGKKTIYSKKSKEKRIRV